VTTLVSRRSWFLKHKVITAVGAVLLLVTFTGIASGSGNKSVTAVNVADSSATSAALEKAAVDKAAIDRAAVDKAVADKAAVDDAGRRRSHPPW